MSKDKSVYVCQACGYESSGWMGRCPGCGAWNTLTEEKREPTGVLVNVSEGAGSMPLVRLTDVSAEERMRFSSGLSELDRVLGGGFVPGSLVLIGGDPGIGKSTLLLQCLGAISRKKAVLYISGEESPRQIRLRADRLQVEKEPIDILAATDFSTIAETLARQKPDLAVIDSIQTIYREDLSSAPGSVSQIREVTAGLLRLSKRLEITLVLVGHVTKDGAIAGPRVLEHMVDTVLYFEGEGHRLYRMLRCVKNRFGATDELGLFEMTDQGLKALDNASIALLAGRPIDVPGSVITVCMEGTRPILIEIQSLLQPSAFGAPLRMTQGLDRNRLILLLAVLEKQFQMGLDHMDTYVNVVGGLKLNEPATDLAVLAAVTSSLKSRPIRRNCLAFGEVGLTGEIRAVSQSEKRIQEAVRQGFSSFVIPGSCRPALEKARLPEECDLYYIDRVGEAMDVLFNPEESLP